MTVEHVLEALRDRPRSRSELQTLLRVDSVERELAAAKACGYATRSNKRLWHLTRPGREHLDLVARADSADERDLCMFDQMMRSNRGAIAA